MPVLNRDFWGVRVDLSAFLCRVGTGTQLRREAAAWPLSSGERVTTIAVFTCLFSLSSLPPPQERRCDMSHHPTFRKIYCDAVPYLFKKVRCSLWVLFFWPYSSQAAGAGCSL